MKSNIVKLSPNTPTPPHKLGEAGLALWNSIQSAYAVDDAAGAEILAHACLAADRLVALGEAIARDGEVVVGPSGPKPHPALSAELNQRHFIARSFERLGLHFEPIKPVGRPPKTFGG
jgi:hypothetical protein